jgi:hypothetical protein
MPSLRFRFVAERRPFSLGIRWREVGKYSHVGAITDDGKYEAGARILANGSTTGRGGVQLRPVDYATFTRIAFVEVPCTEAQHRAFWDAFERIRDERYSLRTIFCIAFGIPLFKDEHGFICDAAMEWCLYKAKMMPKELIASIRLSTPQELYYLTLGMRDGMRMAYPKTSGDYR